MEFGNINSLASKKTFFLDGKNYTYYSLKEATAQLGIDLHRLPNTIKILLENLLRYENNTTVNHESIKAVLRWLKARSSDEEISFYPSRVLMQDFTGVPAIVDLAAMRDASKKISADPASVNPLIPVDLVIDHSVQVDKYAAADSYRQNVEIEMERNKERYEFLKWGQNAFNNFKVVPPGTGICHQVNLEYLAKIVWFREQNGETVIYPDTLVGTDSHTTMVNGLSVLGWGVGGIEAEAAMLGQPLSMVIPEVIGFKVYSKLKEGITATDLVLTITQMLRKKGVVNKFVEFYGEGLKNLPLADRATIANMAPEYGATCGFFPVDEETIKYLQLTARSQELINLVIKYSKEQGLWRNDEAKYCFTDSMELDLSSVEPSLAGPKRPQDRVSLKNTKANFIELLPELNKNPANIEKQFKVDDKEFTLANGHVVIAAITSCTNTSNPAVMIGAGLLAKKARALGLSSKPWVKTSLAPGSKVVSAYLEKAGLGLELDALGFNLVGYGCTTCIGNSGPLMAEIEKTVSENNLVVGAVISGNRNFEGRIHPLVRANYLASPLLCVAYAIAGSINVNLATDAIGVDKDGKNVFLKDVWPTQAEIEATIQQVMRPELFQEKYAQVFSGDDVWQALKSVNSLNYKWDAKSSYIKKPPYFERDNLVGNVENARILAVFGDSITTDHISPAGSISATSPAAKYLNLLGIERVDFNSYGARRGNHEVMMRGTFANTRIKNELLGGLEGGYTKYCGEGDNLSIYDAAMQYISEGIATVIFAGKEYGTGSSRDWAAKGTSLLGVKAIIAESFERIHRSNLIGMGVLPLLFTGGMTRTQLGLVGDETISLQELDVLAPRKLTKCVIQRNGKIINEFKVLCKIDTDVEVEYLKCGGILQYVHKKLV